MKSVVKQDGNFKEPRHSRRHRNNVTELSAYLASREEQRQALVHSLKGKFSAMKFSSDDLIKQRRAEVLMEGQ